MRQRTKSAADILGEIETLAALLREIREQQIEDPDSIALKSKAAVISNHIAARRLLLATLFPDRGAA